MLLTTPKKRAIDRPTRRGGTTPMVEHTIAKIAANAVIKYTHDPNHQMVAAFQREAEGAYPISRTHLDGSLRTAAELFSELGQVALSRELFALLHLLDRLPTRRRGLFEERNVAGHGPREALAR